MNPITTNPNNNHQQQHGPFPALSGGGGGGGWREESRPRFWGVFVVVSVETLFRL